MQKKVIVVDAKHAFFRYTKGLFTMLKLQILETIRNSVGGIDNSYLLAKHIMTMIKLKSYTDSNIQAEQVPLICSQIISQDCTQFNLDLHTTELLKNTFNLDTKIIKKLLEHYEFDMGFKAEIKNSLLFNYQVILFFTTKSTLKTYLVQRAIQQYHPDMTQLLFFRTDGPLPISVQKMIENFKIDVLISHRPKYVHDIFKKSLSDNVIFIYTCSDQVSMEKKFYYEQQLKIYKPQGEITTIYQLVSMLETIQLEQAGHKFILCGYYFARKKFDKIIRTGGFKSRYGIKYVPIDLRFNLNRDIQILLHKVTDIFKETEDTLEGQFILQNLYNMYELKHNQIEFINNPEFMDVPRNRIKFSQLFTQMLTSQEFNEKLNKYFQENNIKPFRIRMPDMLVCNPKEYTLEQLKEKVSKFGKVAIVKTQVMASKVESHMMALAVNEEGLKKSIEAEHFRNDTFLVQEMIDHHERVFKTYIMGNKCYVKCRQSLPLPTKQDLGYDVVFFDTQVPFKDQFSFVKENKEKDFELDINVVNLLNLEIQKTFHFKIYGIDLLKEAGTGDYCLVDLNLFCSFKGCDDVENSISELIFEALKNKQSTHL